MVQDTLTLVGHFRICLCWSEVFAIYHGRDTCPQKKALAAFLPVIAGLATIAVESLNSFLQRKRNKAMASGMIAIKEDQTLAWNSLKQLEMISLCMESIMLLSCKI